MRLRHVLPVLALAAVPARAQQPDTVRLGPPLSWYLTVGGIRAEWAEFGTVFAATGYGALPRDLLLIGGGLAVTPGGFLVGAEGYGMLGGRRASGTRELGINGGAGFLVVGLPLLDAPRARLYPFGGLGGAGVTIRIDQAAGTGVGPDVNNPSFDQVLADPGQRSRLTAGSLALTAGVGFELAARPRALRRGGHAAFTVGVRAGYQWTPYTGEWKMYDLPVIGGPSHLVEGWFVRATVGGSGRAARRERASRGP
jgi:hypothetical protein